MKNKSLYWSLLDVLQQAAELHPRSYVVVDAVTGKLLGSGMNAEKLFQKIRQNLKDGQIPAMFKLPKKGYK